MINEVANLALTIGGLLLNIFVLPTLLSKEARVPRVQSAVYTVGLFILFTIPYLILGMVLPALSTTIGAVLWALVFIYRGENND